MAPTAYHDTAYAITHCAMPTTVHLLSLLLLLAQSAAPVSGARKPAKKKAAPPASPLSPEQVMEEVPSDGAHAGAGTNELLLSITVTPAATEGGVPNNDTARLIACANMLHWLQLEFHMRHEDGQVAHCTFSRERGEEHNNPHLQGHYEIQTTATSAKEVKALVAAEKEYLRAVLSRGTNISLRVAVKVVKSTDGAYAFGYGALARANATHCCVPPNSKPARVCACPVP